MAHEVEYICEVVTVIMIFLIGMLWGLVVIPTIIAVVAAVFYADAKRDGM